MTSYRRNLLARVLVLVGVLGASRTVRADPQNHAGATLGGIVVVGIAWNGYLADYVFATIDTVNAGRHAAPNGLAVPELVAGGVSLFGNPFLAVGTFIPKEATDSVKWSAILAIDSLPFAVTMHGAWLKSDEPLTQPPWRFAGPVVVYDAVVLGVDTAMMLGPHDAVGRNAYGWVETIAAAPQIAFGLAQAAGGGKADVRTTLALTLLPVAMLAHGIYEIARPPPAVDAHADQARPAPSWMVLPSATGGTSPSWGVSVVGVL